MRDFISIPSFVHLKGMRSSSGLESIKKDSSLWEEEGWSEALGGSQEHMWQYAGPSVWIGAAVKLPGHLSAVAETRGVPSEG